jgi:hypothetical protein
MIYQCPNHLCQAPLNDSDVDEDGYCHYCGQFAFRSNCEEDKINLIILDKD